MTIPASIQWQSLCSGTRRDHWPENRIVWRTVKSIFVLNYVHIRQYNIHTINTINDMETNRTDVRLMLAYRMALWVPIEICTITRVPLSTIAANASPLSFDMNTEMRFEAIVEEKKEAAK